MFYRQTFQGSGATYADKVNVKRGALTVAAGTNAYIDFGSTFGPNRIKFWQVSMANALVSWKPASATADVATAAPTPGGSPGDVEVEGSGITNLPQFEMEVVQIPEGKRYWHFFNHEAADVTLYIEGSMVPSQNG